MALEANMKVRIPKIILGIALTVPLTYGTAHVDTESLSHAVDAVSFYGNLPARISDAVTNFKMLPERMNPTCSECN